MDNFEMMTRLFFSLMLIQLASCLLSNPTTFHQQRRHGFVHNHEQRLLASTVSSETSTLPELPDFAHEPLPLYTFSGKIEQALKDEFGKSNIKRVLQCWRMLENDFEFKQDVQEQFPPVVDVKESLRRQLCHSYVPGLTIEEFWDKEKVEWAAKLESKYSAIKREFRNVMADPTSLQKQGNNIWSGALTDDASSYGEGWKTLVLMDRGIWDPINCNLFPVTAKAVHDAKVPAVEVFFASMQPESTIQPHSDFTNFVLTSHLALDIPYSGQNKCRLRIGDTTKEWINGQVTVFDTSLFHDAVNESDQTRYILMMRVWHPDLTPTERHALQFIWDCLENPDLFSAFPEERKQAQTLAQQRHEFPALSKRSGGAKAGFGASGGFAAKQKRKGSKK